MRASAPGSARGLCQLRLLHPPKCNRQSPRPRDRDSAPTIALAPRDSMFPVVARFVAQNQHTPWPQQHRFPSAVRDVAEVHHAWRQQADPTVKLSAALPRCIPQSRIDGRRQRSLLRGRDEVLVIRQAGNRKRQYRFCQTESSFSKSAQIDLLLAKPVPARTPSSEALHNHVCTICASLMRVPADKPLFQSHSLGHAFCLSSLVAS